MRDNNVNNEHDREWGQQQPWEITKQIVNTTENEANSNHER